MASVKIKVDADGAGFHRAMDSVEKRVHHLGHEVSHGLKDAFVGFVGAASIGVLVEHMVEFAHEVEVASDRLNLTVEKIQELRAVARHAGRDLGFFEGAFRNIEKSAAQALGGDSKKRNIFHKLGINDDDLKHMNKADLLQKMMQGAGKMDRSAAEQLLGGVAGGRNGSTLMQMQKELASGEKKDTVSAENIKALAEAKRHFQDLAEKLQVKLLPALINVAQAVIDFGNKLKQGFEVVFAYVEGLLKNIHNFSIKGGAKAIFENEGKDLASVGKNLWAVVTGKESIGDAFNNVWDDAAAVGKDVLTGFFGEDAVKSAEDAATAMGQVEIEEDEQTAKDKADREKEIAEDEARKGGPVNRQAAPTKDKADKELLDKTIKTNNPFLAIGGLLGTDGLFRMQRLQERTNSLLQQIVKNTTPPEDTSDTDETTDAYANG